MLRNTKQIPFFPVWSHGLSYGPGSGFNLMPIYIYVMSLLAPLTTQLTIIYLLLLIDTWLIQQIVVYYQINHFSHESLRDQVPFPYVHVYIFKHSQRSTLTGKMTGKANGRQIKWHFKADNIMWGTSDKVWTATQTFHLFALSAVCH